MTKKEETMLFKLTFVIAVIVPVTIAVVGLVTEINGPFANVWYGEIITCQIQDIARNSSFVFKELHLIIISNRNFFLNHIGIFKPNTVVEFTNYSELSLVQDVEWGCKITVSPSETPVVAVNVLPLYGSPAKAAPLAVIAPGLLDDSAMLAPGVVAVTVTTFPATAEVTPATAPTTDDKLAAVSAGRAPIKNCPAVGELATAVKVVEPTVTVSPGLGFVLTVKVPEENSLCPFGFNTCKLDADTLLLRMFRHWLRLAGQISLLGRLSKFERMLRHQYVCHIGMYQLIRPPEIRLRYLRHRH